MTCLLTVRPEICPCVYVSIFTPMKLYIFPFAKMSMFYVYIKKDCEPIVAGKSCIWLKCCTAVFYWRIWQDLTNILMLKAWNLVTWYLILIPGTLFFVRWFNTFFIRYHEWRKWRNCQQQIHIFPKITTAELNLSRKILRPRYQY